jgi:hypothetical protein
MEMYPFSGCRSIRRVGQVAVGTTIARWPGTDQPLRPRSVRKPDLLETSGLTARA